jgi:hypothetical protein
LLPTVFPFQPNGADPIAEWYGYLTDVLGPSYGGKEQQIQLRRHPTGALEASFFSESRYDYQRHSALLFRKHAQSWAVPLWPYATRLTADASAGATSLSVVTADHPWTDPLGLGPYALLWRDSQTFELASLNAIYPSSIELLAPLAKSWAAASTRLIPVRLALLEQTVPLRWETSECVTGRHHFSFDAHGIGNVVPTLTDDLVDLEAQGQPI